MDILDKEIVKDKKRNDQILIDDVSDDDKVLDGKDIGKPNKYFKMGILTAIDLKDLNYYDVLGNDDNEKDKNFKGESFVVLRWLSSVGDPDWEKWKENGKKGKPPIKDNRWSRYYITATNEIVNKYFWDLSKEPKLQYYLMCAMSPGQKVNHNWIGTPKKDTKSRLNKMIREFYPNINSTELEIIRNQFNSKEDIEEFCKRLALDDKDIKEILKEEGYKVGKNNNKK